MFPLSQTKKLYFGRLLTCPRLPHWLPAEFSSHFCSLRPQVLERPHWPEARPSAINPEATQPLRHEIAFRKQFHETHRFYGLDDLGDRLCRVIRLVLTALEYAGGYQREGTNQCFRGLRNGFPRL